MATITVQGFKASKDDDRRMIEAAVDIQETLLWGYDANGKAILATNVNGGNVRAEGIMVTGTPSKWGAETEFNTTSILETGDTFRPIRCATYQNEGSDPFATYSNAQLGDPVYVGTGGAFTLTKPTTSGELIQVVGYVKSKSSVLIDIDMGLASITQA